MQYLALIVGFPLCKIPWIKNPIFTGFYKVENQQLRLNI